MTKVIDGKKIAERVKDKVTKEIFALNGPRPNLAIVLVGERADSVMYVDMKEKEAKKVGVDTHLYKCEEDVSEKELLEMIECLNKDEIVDAILVQLPLPDGIDTDKIIQAIDPRKDVDFFHPDNLKTLLETCNHSHVMSPVHKTVLAMLDDIEYDLSDKHCCVLCNADVFGKSLVKVLECQKATATYIKPSDENWRDVTKTADVLITAVGKPHFVGRDAVMEDAVVIDVGTTKEGNKVVGDVDFDSVDDYISYISPVPGGVGPATIAMLFENCLELYKSRK